MEPSDGGVSIGKPTYYQSGRYKTDYVSPCNTGDGCQSAVPAAEPRDAHSSKTHIKYLAQAAIVTTKNDAAQEHHQHLRGNRNGCERQWYPDLSRQTSQTGKSKGETQSVQETKFVPPFKDQIPCISVSVHRVG
jgi:hypothetical protein